VRKLKNGRPRGILSMGGLGNARVPKVMDLKML